jgi:hypothetical protein
MHARARDPCCNHVIVGVVLDAQVGFRLPSVTGSTAGPDNGMEGIVLSD